jgi:phosphotransferase system HPr-like phosphotransfer protein
MGVLLLCCAKGTQLMVEADGEQSDLAVQEIGKLIDGGFDEGE